MLTLLAHDGVGKFTNKDAVHKVHFYTFLPICLKRRETDYKLDHFLFFGIKTILDITMMDTCLSM